MRIPVPSLLVAFSALLAKMSNSICYKIVYGGQYTKDYLHIGEGFESILEACLFFVAVERLIKETKRRQSSANPS